MTNNSTNEKAAQIAPISTTDQVEASIEQIDNGSAKHDIKINHSQGNNFDLINAEQSATIFRQFTQGRVITKLVFDQLSSQQQDNPLFTCLFNHESHFKQLYQHLGYQLCLNNEGDFYYVQEHREESSEEADDNALKVQTILLQLGRYYSQTGRDLAQLCQAMFGFNESDITSLSKDDDSIAMLKAIKIESWPKAIDFIVSRNFAYKTGNTNYFISSAGKAFLFNLVEQYSQFEQG